MGLIQRHITEDFINHVLYGDYLLKDDAMFKGETMNETLVYQYVYEMSKYYESELISDTIKERALHGDVFKIWLSINHRTTDDNERHFLTLGLKKIVCVAADYGIRVRDYDLQRFKDIELTGEGNLYDIISEYYQQITPDYFEHSDKVVLPEWKDTPDEIKALFIYPDRFTNFLKGCYMPNGIVKDIKGIVDSYNRYRRLVPETIAKGVPKKLYKYLLGIGIIKVDNPEDNPDQRLRTFQRNLEKLQKP